MILSICMMIKNEEKNIERCLKSLGRLRETIDSELIIVDTGSTDNTVEIAKKYTNDIYYHEWDNNFSEMRNKTMSYAKGKWILILDADEELVSDDDLIAFLSVKQDKEITGATLYLRNIKNQKENSYSSELITIRIIKNKINAYYEGSVHNRLVIKGKVMQLNALLNHYGYILDDKELMERKFLRTKNMLIEELKITPDSPYLLYQLATSYGMHNEWEESYVYSKKAFDLILDNNLSFDNFPYVISGYCKDSYATGKYREAIRAAEIGLEVEPDFVDLYFYKASSLGKLNELKESMKEYKNYLDCLKRFENSNFKYNPSIQHYSLHSQNEAYCNLALLNIELGNNEEAIMYAQLLFEIENEESMYVKSIINKYISTLIKENRISLFNDLFFKYKFDILELIEQIESNLSKISSNERDILYQTLSKIDNYYGIINKYRVSKLYEFDRVSETDINELKQGVIRGIPEVMYLCLKLNIALEELYVNLDETNIMNQIAISNERFDDFETQIIKRLEIISNKRDYVNINANRIYNKYLVLKHISNKNCVEYFDEYYISIQNSLLGKYNTNFLSIGLYSLFSSREEQFGAIIYNVLSTYNSELVLKAIEIYPEMKDVLLNWLSRKLEKTTQTSEMDALKSELKVHIFSLRDLKKYRESIVIIDEALSLMPNDLELIGIKAELMLLEKSLSN